MTYKADDANTWTQEQRDEYYRNQKVAVLGNPDGDSDRCGWLKNKYYFEGWRFIRGQILDLACHDGYVTRRFIQDLNHVTGVDISKDAILNATVEATKEYPHLMNGFTYIEENFCSPSASVWVPGKYDMIVNFEWVEHIPRDVVGNVFKWSHGSLKVGGHYALSTPTPTGQFDAHDNHFHINLYTKEDLLAQIKQCTGEDAECETDGNFWFVSWTKTKE